MSFEGLLIHDVVIYPWTAGSDDTYGGVEDDFGTGVEVTGRIMQVETTEFEIDRDTRTVRAKLFLPAGTAIAATSEVAYGSARYRVDGEPYTVYDGDDAHHIEADLFRVVAG